VHLRDAGLRRISFATRALVIGSVTAAGAFSAMAAWAQPGRKSTSTAGAASNPVASLGTSPKTKPATVPATVAPESGDDDLNPPATVPATVPATAPAQYTPPTYQYSPPVVSSQS
jgi:hypothetical protein